MMIPNDDKNYSEKEAQKRFEAALKSALNTPHKPLKEKSKVRKVAKPKNKPAKRKSQEPR